VLRPGAVRRIPFGLGRGLRLEADPQTTLHVYLGTAEIEIAGHLRRLARPGSFCFDVGSNNGYYAMALARLTGVGAVALEFAPDGLERIRRNLARNDALGASVRLVEAYVTNVVDPAQRATTLDRVSEELGTPDLLKIDVEGAELTVLQGAEHLLARGRGGVRAAVARPRLCATGPRSAPVVARGPAEPPQPLARRHRRSSSRSVTNATFVVP
jgi:Methyltransferase FkbM domain